MRQMQPEPIEVTVVFLEMEVRPTSFPPLPGNRQIALLRTHDIPLHFYRYLTDRVGRKWSWVHTLRQSDEELLKELHGKDREVWVLYLEGSPAGFFDLSRATPGVVDLGYFGLMKHAMGQGLGRWFLGSALSVCWETQPRLVTVQTCTLDHPAALPLYQKMGFHPVGQSHEVIQPLSFDERMAIVMR
ncbi:GNAT family N-acetyltransferase [Aquamicrobium segne]|uniref:GNAT family N-acetyltransferase n=1 Tax=Aquamicrobium segne TaxID=469547 RepID=A0ABW0GWA6_9HYPH